MGQKISIHETWASGLSSAISERLSSRVDLVFQNSSVNGTTTRLALERMGPDVLLYQPSYVLVQVGLNDSNYWESDRGEP